MLKSLHLKNFTVFPDAKLEFGRHLNVIIGENGTGKTHVLKAAYTALAVGAAKSLDIANGPPSTSRLQIALADKLRGVFRPDALGRLVRRKVGRGKCELDYEFDQKELNLRFSFSTLATDEVTLITKPSAKIAKQPAYLPTRELLTIYPGFVSLYETSHIPFEETWRDTCVLLGAGLARGPREATIKRLLGPLEESMGGKLDLDKSGRFYLKLSSGNMEIYLVAEGLRKLAMVARLIATGILLDKGYLFWDEPEANLNPTIIKQVARIILNLSAHGIQIFIATHSLFLLRELHILQLQSKTKLETRCFGLHLDKKETVELAQGATMDDVGNISALDEELEQSKRYLEEESH